MAFTKTWNRVSQFLTNWIFVFQKRKKPSNAYLLNICQRLRGRKLFPSKASRRFWFDNPSLISKDDLGSEKNNGHCATCMHRYVLCIEFLSRLLTRGKCIGIGLNQWLHLRENWSFFYCFQLSVLKTMMNGKLSWVLALLLKQASLHTFTDAPQPKCVFQVSFPLLWIRMN